MVGDTTNAFTTLVRKSSQIYQTLVSLVVCFMQFIIQYEPFSSPNALLITSFKSSECSICSSSIFHRHRPLLHWYHRVVISILGLIRICKAVRVFNAVYRVRKSGGRKRTHIKTHNVCAPSLHLHCLLYIHNTHR